MSRIQILANVLTNIERVSEKIIQKNIDILSTLRDSDNDMVDEIIDNYPDMEIEEIITRLRETAYPLTRDAEKVMEEIQEFSDNVIQGEEILTNNSEKYPFLIEVWCGDTYEEEGIQGLQLLYEDLTRQKNIVSEDVIVAKVLDSMK